MKDALKDLFRAACRAPVGTVSLEGDGGLVATFEESKVGPSRLIRIMEGSKTVRWSFHLLPDEPQPQFYPSDLPFLSGKLMFNAWWEEKGIGASWSSFPGEDLAEFHSAVKPLVDEVQDLPGVSKASELLKEVGGARALEVWEEVQSMIPSSFLDAYAEAAKRHFGIEVPEEVIARADEISAFHEADGWTSIPGQETPGPTFCRMFQKGGKRRELTARWFLGMDSITLEETSTP